MPQVIEKYSASNPAPRDVRFKAGIAAFAKSDTTGNVDIENRQLNGCLLCAAGEAEGWGYSIEASFVTDLIAFAKKLKNGVRCNLMHNYENTGYQLGKISNIRLDGDSARGDLSIYKAADKSPRAPGMGAWLLDLVQEDPEAAMMSVRVTIAYFYQKSEFGAEVKVWEYDDTDRWISPNYAMPIYAKFGSLESCDVVAEGALTDAMFSNTPTPHQEKHWFKDMLAQFSKALGLHKGPDDLDSDGKKTDPSVVEAPQATDDNTTLITEFSKSDTDMTKEDFDALNARLDKLDAAVLKSDTEKDGLKKELDAAKADADKLRDELTAAKDDIKKLDASAADTHADGDKSTGKDAKKVGFGKHHEDLKTYYGLK